MKVKYKIYYITNINSQFNCFQKLNLFVIMYDVFKTVYKTYKNNIFFNNIHWIIIKSKEIINQWKYSGWGLDLKTGKYGSGTKSRYIQTALR